MPNQSVSVREVGFEPVQDLYIRFLANIDFLEKFFFPLRTDAGTRGRNGESEEGSEAAGHLAGSETDFSFKFVFRISIPLNQTFP